MARLAKAKAVEYAFNWHGGMTSPLYSFASCGGVVHSEEHRAGLVAEVTKCHLWATTEGTKYPKEYAKEPHRLERLLDFIKGQPVGVQS